ncbi:hypothetical protein ABB30_10390 [Stenotrophomonas ginsengisoli]|uniref:Manganese/iron superoxide dismutase C-terminal domain-containing protein n=1 Tax=Stenotrophomonas ginsengisoli TaxID=336566 RepID=A0A0R0DD18_9GAMM|nr:Fe-Mn family superoxide dismutase [Stenotrophomonas ginsengisoli]KRG76202.1 hypothetical protein ABB30_10390 [Stenotrophomonas ginsengisoli]
MDKYQLPYPTSALQPHLDTDVVIAQLARLHATQQALHAGLANTDLAQMELDVVIASSQGQHFELAASLANQRFFLDGLCSSRSGGEPGGRIGERIKNDFGTLGALHDAFAQLAAGMPEGSWIWLVEQADGRLAITAHPRIGNPMTGTSRPLLTCPLDPAIWGDEDSADLTQLLPRFWKLVNWDAVERNLR